MPSTTQSTPPTTQYDQLYQSVGKKPKRSLKIWVVLGAISVLLIIFGSVVSILFPPQITVQDTTFARQNVDGTQTQLTSITFTGESPELPTTLSIARRSQETIPTQQTLAAIAAKYSLTRPDPSLEEWQGAQYSLAREWQADTYLLLLTSEWTDRAIPPIDEQSALGAASRFIADVLPSIALTPISESIEFFSIGQELQPAPKESANGLRVAFAPQIDGIPLFYQKSTQPPFTLLIDGNNEIMRMVFYPLFDRFTPVQTVPTLSIEEALANIRSGRASIIDSTFRQGEPTLPELSSADLKNISLEYREDPEQQLLIPFYRFTGVATTRDDRSADIILITPATKVL